jgi:Sulfotransferase family
MTLPNFIIVGAPKAGTGSLRNYLRQHPEVFMTARKDPRFFSYNGQQDRLKFPVTNLAEYEALFSAVRGEKAIGEATANYFWSRIAPERIRETIPEARLIVSLRDPAQRAFSIYHMNLRTQGQNEDLSFLQALEVDPIVQRAYHDDLKAYFDRFDRRQIKIVLFEDLADDTLATVRSLYRFLGVDSDFVPDLKIDNPGGVPRSKWLHRLMTDDRLRTWARNALPEAWVAAAKDVRSFNLDKRKMQMTEEERDVAAAFFRDDILRTQDLIGMDLARWLTPAAARAA